MKRIKSGKDITPSMVTRFVELVGNKELFYDPLPIKLSSSTLTGRNINYSEEHVKSMIVIIYGYLPSIIKKKIFVNKISKLLSIPPDDALKRIFGDTSEIGVNTFIKKFLAELTS
ncbi:hypothetical protein 15D039_00195 [Fowlpox virus]|nr:hypothetical protein 10D392_00195 [Fowlpox virus]URH25698.1 hypothetical protein 15D039_00195 [Fowlpox virus]URH25959.1 hypothetical protein 18Q061_00199 [Fowlpox virus]URH27805.1 hypothetical protein V_poxine_00202 [Fowlpox virus]URH28063.1 hypothetical protein V_blen_00198 [Fowlpox virus]